MNGTREDPHILLALCGQFQTPRTFRQYAPPVVVALPAETTTGGAYWIEIVVEAASNAT